MKEGRLIVAAGQTTAALSRRRFLAGTAAGAIALGPARSFPLDPDGPTRNRSTDLVTSKP